MRTHAKAQLGRLRAAGTVLLLVASLGGCGLEEVDIPDLDGPSTYGTGVRVSASPDIILADGLSTALVTANIWDNDGRAATGRQVFFQISHATGLSADIGKLRSTGPDQELGTGLLVRTDGSGAARVVYVAPPRTDFTANGSVLVTVRPVGDDAAGAVTHSVRIELRSAEPRLFPGVFGCGFVVEPAAGPYRVNTVVGFQNTADGIRFEWYFGDGTPVAYGTDQAHVFRVPGTFLVTLVVTSSLGTQSACGAPITVIP
jgi:hypothetical protein